MLSGCVLSLDLWRSHAAFDDFAIGSPLQRLSSSRCWAIVGTVVDPSGAAVNGATITAKDLDRGTILTTTTNDEGAFNISGVPVGRYEIKAAATGFQSAINPAFRLTLNQTARLNFQLRIGQTTETVEVTATNAEMQTMNATIGNTLTGLALESLPGLGRDVSTFVTLPPGVS